MNIKIKVSLRISSFLLLFNWRIILVWWRRQFFGCCWCRLLAAFVCVDACLCVCVLIWEVEREREREGGRRKEEEWEIMERRMNKEKWAAQKWWHWNHRRWDQIGLTGLGFTTQHWFCKSVFKIKTFLSQSLLIAPLRIYWLVSTLCTMILPSESWVLSIRYHKTLPVVSPKPATLGWPLQMTT